MSPATRLTCQLPSYTWGVEELGEIDQETGEAPVEVVAGGRYMTPGHLSTVAQTQQDMGFHMEAHKLDQVGSRQPAAQESKSKPAKLDRPRMEMDMSEAEWDMFMAEWGRYVRSCRITEDQEKVDQLWGCLSPALKKAAAGDGLGDVETEGVFIPRLKTLAVKKHNPVVAQVKFLQTGQDRNEPINSFVARLRGVAAQCNFSVRCGNITCGKKVSYTDQMISHMLIRGLEDLTFQDKVMTLVAERGEQTLQQLVAYIEAMEVSKRSQGLMGTAQLARMGVSKAKPGAQGASKPKQGAGAAKLGNCKGCGKDRSDHRGGKCFAAELECRTCKAKGHISRVCPKKTGGSVKSAEVAPAAEESSGEVSLLSPTQEAGFFFAGEELRVGVAHHIFS